MLLIDEKTAAQELSISVDSFRRNVASEIPSRKIGKLKRYSYEGLKEFSKCRIEEKTQNTGGSVTPNTGRESASPLGQRLSRKLKRSNMQQGRLVTGKELKETGLI